ncbi:MAG: hypothetical protein HRU17_22775 [Polyangiaceae bacterium]|nr:hypothetical protein [Polyangiaceae bacterium]
MGEGNDLLASFSQGGQSEARLSEPSVEILSEGTGFDAAVNINVSRRDHSHVDGDLGVGTNGAHFPFFQHPQQCWLQIEG